MFVTYLYSMFVNALLKSVKSFAFILGGLMIALLLIVLPYSIQEGLVVRNLTILSVTYGIVVSVFAMSFCRCSDTVVFFKYFNYLVLAVKDPKVYHAYYYGEVKGRSDIATKMGMDSMRGLRKLIKEVNPSVIHFTTHTKILDVLKGLKVLNDYTYEESKCEQHSLKLEACVLNSFQDIQRFKRENKESFIKEIVATRQFHTGKFVKAN